MDKAIIQNEYTKLVPKLNEVVKDITDELYQFIDVKSLKNIDFVKYRIKDIDSFVKKATIEEDGKQKYPNPLLEIQDIIGVRIIVYYLSDVDKVHGILKKSLYNQIEAKHHQPRSEEDFKYEGKHFIIPLSQVTIKKHNLNETIFPKVFELQILTLFQHAWATGEHDLTYKPKYSPTRENKRYLAFVAAQAWGADQIFDRVNDELNSEEGTKEK